MDKDINYKLVEKKYGKYCL